MCDPHPYYSKYHVNERIWLNNNVKKFYIINVYKLNSFFIYKNIQEWKILMFSII